MPVNQKKFLIHQSALKWTSGQYPNADVSRSAAMTQKWKAKEKTLGTKHSVLKIFIFEKFSNVDRWLLQKPSADLILGLSRTEFVK